jgi:acyl carrier protein
MSSQSSQEELKTQITRVFASVFKEHTQEEASPVLNDDSLLFETGLDSLGFALLVIRLEEELGYDPFVIATEAYYPQTFGDFVRFYEANQPQ